MKRALPRYGLSVLMVIAGAMHFINEAFYLKMMPPFLPFPRELVFVSGVFEILGGLGLLLAATRRWAAWGLVALYVAVFPANIHVAIQQIDLVEGTRFPLGNWLRLPLQAGFIGWALWIARKDRA